MNIIIYDDKIITPKGNKYKYYNIFLKKLEQRGCVKFALFCAKIVNPNTKKSNLCIRLIEKWLKDGKSVKLQELKDAAVNANDSANANNSANDSVFATAVVTDAIYAAVADYPYCANAATYAVSNVAIYSVYAAADKINQYLQILLRKTKQFQNNKILEQISKVDVDKLELVDWNMITDIMQEEYNVIHEFSYEDIFSRRCLIELLRREYI